MADDEKNAEGEALFYSMSSVYLSRASLYSLVPETSKMHTFDWTDEYKKLYGKLDQTDPTTSVNQWLEYKGAKELDAEMARELCKELKKKAARIRAVLHEQSDEKLQNEYKEGYEEPTPDRMTIFDGFVALSCSPDRAECALAELDYMWDTVWSVRFPAWFAHCISFKNALAIGMGGLMSRLAKIGIVAGIIGAWKSLFGNVSL